ncbi:carbohydrate kinase [Streptomyces sp. NRRL F-6602]|uniref:sugar kinase n=1 Tax=Streptomyces sp. GSL17-113 TaxID=3115365 RepID=UPI0006B59DD1|nr:sugar kinase [Streptomyces sp. GSL17-113]KPC92908.1 carbohydrate kinase [Streptomyces sp. NRRL F-6602]
MTTTPKTDVVCLGESMVTFLPSRPGPLADVPSFRRAIGGAESNVACALARAGYRTRWVSRVGADGFGDHLLRTIAAHGVDTTAVERDPDRPTGIYFRTDGERATGPTAPDGTAATDSTDGTGSREGAGTTDSANGSAPADGAPGTHVPATPPGRGAVSEVVYYRAGSAASAMSPATVPAEALGTGRVLHLTGITAALSADCLALLRALTTDRPAVRDGAAPGPLVSFDVNYRVSLWRTAPEPGAGVLLELARHSDIVFVGEDEAAAAWGVTGGPDAVRAALPEPAVLVVKQGSAGATAYVGDAGPVFAPALRVDVVSPIGAGDAFAAGFLAGTLRGLPVRERLRHGHLLAAAALTDAGDLAAPPARETADRLVALDDGDWGRLRLGPGWTSTPPHGPAPADAGPPAPRTGRTEPEVPSA